jgi:hypothetical protein
MHRVCAKFVPRLLSDDLMESRMNIAGDLFEKSTQDSSLLGKVVTGDESWVFAYDLRQRCSQPNGTQARPRAPRSPEQQNSTLRSCSWRFSMTKE